MNEVTEQPSQHGHTFLPHPCALPACITHPKAVKQTEGSTSLRSNRLIARAGDRVHQAPSDMVLMPDSPNAGTAWPQLLNPEAESLHQFGFEKPHSPISGVSFLLVPPNCRQPGLTTLTSRTGNLSMVGGHRAHGQPRGPDLRVWVWGQLCCAKLRVRQHFLK